MRVEHEVKVIPIGPDHQKEVAEFAAKGWQLIPGMIPVGIYPVVRVMQDTAEGSAPVVVQPGEQIPDQAFGAVGKLEFDETRMGIMRAGTDEVEWPDGTKTKFGEEKKFNQ